MFLQMTRLLLCKFETSNFGFFPFADQKSTLPGKVDFFISGHFAGQSDTFFKVQLYRAKLNFCRRTGFLDRFSTCFELVNLTQDLSRSLPMVVRSPEAIPIKLFHF